ncbi:MAG: amidohydrolase [Candidatus Eremiobacteraeota bacterium]|nr:amidohydrolase [Candidatus Eremiobacteraeota bacterium]
MPEIDFLKKSLDIFDWTRDIYRKIHRNPELSGNEKMTSALVVEELVKLGIKYMENVGGHGVTGLLNGVDEGRCIILRADMDALCIQERTGLPYSSTVPGVMHACGHDSHTAMLLGAARILSQHRDKFKGAIKFIFQPSEESPPGGAKLMIEDGIMENPKPDAAFAIHVYPTIDCGKVAIGKGPVMASAGPFSITLTGPGGHASAPHETVDLITIAANLILSIQLIRTREFAPSIPMVITIGKITGGERRNAIASKVKMEGTIRTIDDNTMKKIKYRIKNLTKQMCDTWNASSQVKFLDGYPTTINDPEFASMVENSMAELLGDDSVIKEVQPQMAAEDFSYIAGMVPSVIIRIGCRNEETGCTEPLHSPFFKIDENTLKYGPACYAKVAMDFLNS